MQTWDMLQQLRCRTGTRGMLPIDVPGVGVYQCKDGYVFGYVGAPGGAPWTELLQWMIDEGAAEDLTEEPYREIIMNLNLRFLTEMMQDPASVSDKVKILNHIDEVLRRFIGSRGKWEIYEGGQRRRLLFGIVSTPEDIAKNPQLEHRRWLTAVEHPELNATLHYPGPPYRLSETPWSIRRRPPLLGEHNLEIYEGELRLKREELERLSAAGVI